MLHNIIFIYSTISDWLKISEPLILELDDQVESAVLALIMQHLGSPVLLFSFLEGGKKNPKIAAFATDYQLNVHWIEDRIESILTEQFQDFNPTGLKRIDCTRSFKSTILSYLSEKFSAKIVSSSNLNDHIFSRTYHPFQNFADLFPLVDLFRSDIEQLFAYLAEKFTPLEYPNSETIYAKHFNASMLPESARLILSGQNNYYDRLEWAWREDQRSQIISDSNPPRHPEWSRFSAGQRADIALFHQQQKETLFTRAVPINQWNRLNLRHNGGKFSSYIT